MDDRMGLILTVIIFSILNKDILCQQGPGGGTGFCRGTYERDNSFNETNILYVCTTSSSPDDTSIVYLDTTRAPTLDNSTCFCTITFSDDAPYSVDIDYTIHAGSANRLEVTALGASVTNTGNTRSAVTANAWNRLTFSVNTEAGRVRACLRISEKTPGGSSFRAECFQRDEIPTNPSFTERQTTDEINTGDSSGNSVNGALIGGIVGGVVLVLIVVVVIIVIIKRRKNRSSRKEEDYYITENAMYNKPIEVKHNTPTDQNTSEYDAIDTVETKQISDGYAEVLDSRENSLVKQKTEPETLLDNTYNQINEVPPVVLTDKLKSKSTNKHVGPSAYEDIDGVNRSNYSEVYDYIDKDRGISNVKNVKLETMKENAYNEINEVPTAGLYDESRRVVSTDKEGTEFNAVDTDKLDDEYAVVVKNRGNAITRNNVPYIIQDSVYDHLHEIPSPVPTGNVYSITGNRQSEVDDFYNSTSRSGHRFDQVSDNMYDTTGDVETIDGKDSN